MAWIVLVLAGLFEVGFTTAMRYSAGFSKPLPTVVFFAFAIASFYLLTKASEHIPLGTSYAVWTGIGAAGTVLVGLVWFGEPVSLSRLSFLVLLIGSLVGLKLVS